MPIGITQFRQGSIKTTLGNMPMDSFDLYFVPTTLIEQLAQKSISLGRIKALKNNYKMLENCKNRDFVIAKCKEYGILGSK